MRRKNGSSLHARGASFEVLRRRALGALLAGALIACGGSTTTPATDGGSGDDGGTGSDGGVGGDAGGKTDGGASCSSTPATFHLEGTGSFCDNPTPCGDLDWLTIRKGDGTPLAIKACPAVGCASPPRPITLPASTTWDGSYYVNCGDTSTLTCVPPGHYIAHLCLYENQGDAAATCVASSTPVCKDVPFDWPTAATISGSLP